jgi:CPA2 family monovalent cation:H+ antiporter-2
MPEQLLQEYLVILTSSLLGTVIFRRLGMATIVAYIAVGILIGPYALRLIQDPDQFSLLAEFGVAFLLFTLGLEFSPAKMLAMRFVVFGVGGFQVIACTIVFTLAVYIWGASYSTAILIAGALALSSTAIVTRELFNNRQIQNLHGQLSVGVLIFQDLVAVIFLVLVPVLGNTQDVSLLSSLLTTALNAGILLAILLAAGKWILPAIYKEVAKGNSGEIFLLSTLVIALLAAWLTHSFHLSMALGAFITGMMLGEGPFKYQIESDIRPFKDILLGLFFVTIGMNVDVSILLDYWLRIIVFTLGLIIIKASIVAFIVKMLGYTKMDALVVGLNLAQAGEFGLALMALTILNNVIPYDQASFIIIIAAFSMILSPFLIRHADWIGKKISKQQDPEKSPPVINLHLGNHVIIGGYGRLGSMVTKFLEQNDIPYIVIENNINTVEAARKQGKNIVYGNSNNIDLLNHCHLSTSRLAVLTFRSLEEGKATISNIRQRNINVPIIARCLDQQGVSELITLGANHVFPELLESSLLISEHVLDLLAIDESEIDRQIQEQRELSGLKPN